MIIKPNGTMEQINYAVYLNQPSDWFLDKGEHTKGNITVFKNVGTQTAIHN